MTSARDPFEQLERCHRRLEDHLAELSGIAKEARSAAADVDAIRDVAGFFARAIRRHEADEETSLFPRLRASAASAELAPLLDRLASEHHAHVALHARLDAVIEVLDRVPDDAAGVAELSAVTEALVSAYATHVEEEERILFPAAKSALDEATLAAIAAEMQARRGDGGGGGGAGGGGGGGGGGGRRRVG